MELEISVEDLLNKRKIESDRIEFKAGWNPDDIYHSVCAFANDYNNDGGGYIVVGVEEKNGVAVRPVKGISEYMLDEIQKEMLSYNNMISPPYFPKAIPLEVDGKWILVIVVRTGQQRPYKSPEHVTGKKDKKYNYYIRYLTSSVKANAEQERELINMSDQTPYDCRANHKAAFDDISPVLLEDHLRKTGSKLAKQVKERGVEEILEDMQLLVGPPELRYIQNVAIMMFCEHPDRFFPYTYVQMTSFPQGSTSQMEKRNDHLDGEQSVISEEKEGAQDAYEDSFPKTMGAVLREKLSAQAEGMDSEHWTVAKIRPVTPDVIPPDMLRRTELITRGLSIRIQGLMQSLSMSASYPSTKGRLNTAKLYRIKAENPKVFIQRTECVAVNTSLHILLDASASMYGKPMELATASCHAIASACSAIKGLNTAVTAFNGNYRGDVGLVYPLLKHGHPVHARFNLMPSGGTPLAPALWWVMQQLLFAKERRKMLFVLTDGQPTDMTATRKALKMAHKIGLEVYGVGILDGSINNILPDASRVIYQLEELPAMLFELLHDVLTRKNGSCL